MVTFAQCFPDQPKPENICEFAMRFYGLSEVKFTFGFSPSTGAAVVTGRSLEDGTVVRIPWRLLSDQYDEAHTRWTRTAKTKPSCTSPREE